MDDDGGADKKAGQYAGLKWRQELEKRKSNDLHPSSRDTNSHLCIAASVGDGQKLGDEAKLGREEEGVIRAEEIRRVTAGRDLDRLSSGTDEQVPYINLHTRYRKHMHEASGINACGLHPDIQG